MADGGSESLVKRAAEGFLLEKANLSADREVFAPFSGLLSNIASSGKFCMGSQSLLPKVAPSSNSWDQPFWPLRGAGAIAKHYGSNGEVLHGRPEPPS